VSSGFIACSYIAIVFLDRFRYLLWQWIWLVNNEYTQKWQKFNSLSKTTFFDGDTQTRAYSIFPVHHVACAMSLLT
jgi:hypothetical protein